MTRTKIKFPPGVKNIEALENYILIATFDNGIKKKYDLKPLLKEKNFEPLRDKKLFKRVKVDAGGYAIVWNDKTDLAENELWTNGKIVE